MTQFILNNTRIHTEVHPGTTLLDFVRYHQHLTGTKIGCREGDCGACTVMVGQLEAGELVYRTATACLMALGNAHGKHIVTVEGLNMEQLSPVQQAMANESATQCGFCTPGFVVSLSAFCVGTATPTPQNAIAAIDGNICRCTGYKSIEKAAARVSSLLADRKSAHPVEYAVIQQLVPAYFGQIKDRLYQLLLAPNGQGAVNGQPPASLLGGGTDLYVQQHEKMEHTQLAFLNARNNMQGVWLEGDVCCIGGGCTVTALLESPYMQRYFPQLAKHIKLVSSTPIRNMATVGGNFVNASPIGDLTIFFLAIDAWLVLQSANGQRTVPLRSFYKGYKLLNKAADEVVETIGFNLPGPGFKFSFEKVSKRTHLDIASVNSALALVAENNTIQSAVVSAGGVGPVPMVLQATSQFLVGRQVTERLVQQAVALACTEIAPISDVRGTAQYKTLLLQQLVKAHFLTLFPGLSPAKILNVTHEEH